MMIALAAMVTVLVVASLAVSAYALITAHRLFHAAKAITEAVRAECAAVAAASQSQCGAIANEVRTMKPESTAETVPGAPKPGMNLTRRSHALRLHRKGSSPAHIAASLDVPRQEVELLLKVHEIGLNNL